MAHTATAPCTSCPRCRAQALGLGAGPYSSKELQQLVDEPARAERDPDVAAAEAERDAARATFDSFDRTWQHAAAARHSAGLREDVDPATRRQLHEDEEQAREVRDRSWRAVVRANDEIRAAQARAERAVATP